METKIKSKEKNKMVKRITVGLILSWVFGVLFLIAGIGICTDSPIIGFLIIICSAMIIPYFNKITSEHLHFEVSGGIKIVLVIIILILAGFASSKSNSEREDVEIETTEGVQQEATPGTTKESPKSETIFNIGEKIVIDNIEYVVEEAFSFPIVGSQYFNKEASGTFVILSVKVSNNKKNEILLTSNDFKLKDTQGRVYNGDTEASIYLGTMGFEPFLFETLGAGLSKTGEIIFDVPSDDKGLILVLSGESLFSGTRNVRIGDVSELD